MSGAPRSRAAPVDGLRGKRSAFPTALQARRRRGRELITHISIAVPPLGCGNGGLDWDDVRPRIERALGALPGVDVSLYGPSRDYRNVAKNKGVERLTPARALVAELVRRYWVLGNPCSILEIQKLAWFLEREIDSQGLVNPLKLEFVAHRYGPFADKLRHLLDGLDGSCLKSDVRLADARPSDVIAFDDARRERIELYLRTEAASYQPALEATAHRIDGFESPLGMELLATVDWLLAREARRPDLDSIKEGLRTWPGGSGRWRPKAADLRRPVAAPGARAAERCAPGWDLSPLHLSRAPLGALKPQEPRLLEASDPDER